MELKDATMATRKMVMGATQHARSSADSPALTVTQACARQPAETASALATRHATTATLLVDAVRTAVLLNLDGSAMHHQHAVNRFAVQFVETGFLSMEVKNATVVMGATPPHARPSADSPALAMYARQSAETARSLATRHATTATLWMGMDAVITAQMYRTGGFAM